MDSLASLAALARASFASACTCASASIFSACIWAWYPGEVAWVLSSFAAAASSRVLAAVNAASASATLLNFIESRAFTWLYVTPPKALSISSKLARASASSARLDSAMDRACACACPRGGDPGALAEA